MKYLIIVLVTVLIFGSCNNNWGKYGGYKLEYDSALEYYIVLDKGQEIYGTNAADLVKKGTLVKYYRASGVVDSLFLGKGGIVIESFVDDDNVCFDNKFIIIRQKPLKDICECNDSCLTNRYLNKNELPTYKMCEDALEKSVFYQYWIIDKLKDDVYGPFDKETFLKEKVKLKISDKLVLLPTD